MDQWQVYLKNPSNARNRRGYEISYRCGEFKIEPLRSGGIYWERNFIKLPYSDDCIWIIYYTKHLLINMGDWDDFILSSFSYSFIPLDKLIYFLTENFTGWLPKIEFTDVK